MTGQDERVRFCAACGEAVDFDRRTCPSCGHHEPLARPVEAGEPGPCPACGKPAPRDLVFCPECGTERGAVPPPPTREAADEPSNVRALTGVVLGLTVLGPVALAAAVAYVLL
jgi:RNA polymerase subunit RPABC4/transcription elongation factor Spt4